MKSSTNRALVAKKQSTSFAQVANNLLNVLQGYTKSIRLLLVMFLTLTITTNAWGADVTINASQITGFGSGSNYTSSTITIDDITIASSSGFSTTQFRVAKSANLVISCAGKMTKIVFTVSSTSYKLNATGIDWSGTTGTYTNASGIETVTFTNSSSNIARITKIVITYTSSSSGGDPADPYTVTLKDDDSTLTQSSAGKSVTLPPRDGCAGYTFVGWTKTWSVDQTTWTTTAPTIIPTGSYTPIANESLYPVYTKTESGTPVPATLTASYTSHSGWTATGCGGSSYWVLKSGASITSPVISDLSTVTSITFKVRTYGGGTYKTVNVSTSGGTSIGSASASNTTLTSKTINVSPKLSGSGSIVFSSTTTSSSYGPGINDITINYSTGGSTTYYISVPDCATETGLSVTYNGNGNTSGSVPEDNTEYEKDDQVIVLDNTDLAKTGYTFNGWNTESDGTGTPYTAGETFTITKNTTLYAQWEEIPTYTVTFDSDGGSPVASQIIEEGKTATIPSPPTKTGFTFGGWYKEEGCTSAWNFETDVVASDITLYAKWTINQYTVTLNPNYPNGKTGTFTYDAGELVDGNLVLTYVYNTASKTIADLYTSLTLDGYEFGGWYSASGVNPGEVSGSKCTTTGTITGNKTYYANWSKLYSITLSENGTTTELAAQTSTSYTLPTELSAGSCQGDTKELVGWSTVEIPNPGDKPTSDFYELGETVTLTTDQTTFYAVFATAEGDGGSAGETTTVAFGDQVVIIQIDDEKTELTGFRPDKVITDNNNYGTYAAYSTTPSATLVWTVEEGASDGTFAFKNGNYYLNLGGNDNYLSCSTTKNTSSSWTVTENNDRAIVTNVEHNSRKIMWNQSSPRFASYAKNHGLNTNQYYYHIKFYKLNGGITYSDYTTTCDNTKATITYDLNGGTGATCERQTVTKGEAFTLCDQTPTKTGYTFAGWTDGVNTYNAGESTSVTDNTKFYAKWTAKTITITWNQNYTGCPEPIEMQYVYDSDENTIPEEPVREGYQFVGWFTGLTDGVEITEIGEENRPTDNVTYYAHWDEQYTVTYFASGQQYLKQEYKYTSGEKLVLPETDPSAANFACDGYLFEGWSKYQQTKEDANCPELVDANTLVENDLELHAVWKKASTSGAGTQIFYESFNTEEGSGANDDDWGNDVGTETLVNDTWNFANGYGAYHCVKLGSSKNRGSATTPALTQLSGDAKLSFKAAAWVNNNETTTLNLSISGGGTLTPTSVTMVKGAWTTYEVQIKDGTPSSTITFAAANAANNRFFLDEVMITTSGSYNYTTSPNCGPTMVAKENVWATSATGQSVKVNVPLGIKLFEGNATITGTSTNENFVVNTLENAGNGEHNLVVVYTPTADDIKENTTITLTAKVGEETISTTTFTLNGRSLPDEFVIVAQYNDKWLAVPANMQSGADQYNGIEVTPDNALTQIPVAPSTTIYSLRGVADNRYEEAGTCVRLVGNGNKCLWGNAATTNTTIQNWTTLASTNGSNYEWLLTTSDGELYTIANPAHPDYNQGRILSNSGSKYGLYKGTTKFYILPVGCSSLPGNIQVTARRVDATFSWEGNASSMKIDVYTNELMTEGNISNTATASPYYMTGLAESTQYWFKMTPNGTDYACAYTGSFKTTGPTIDVVEWKEDAAVIFVDKDEELNPLVIIDGEVEHGVGTGSQATELFFSKYFEAHAENKLLAIYNGKANTIDLTGYTIKSENGTLDLSQFGQTKGEIAPNEEIILVYFDATYSAESCAEQQDNYETWNVLDDKSVLAFSGRGSIGLYKNNTLIDVIGSTFPSGELTKIGKSGSPDNCGTESDVRLYIDGVSVNDQSSFFCYNGDNIKTPEVEDDYAISTNRCLLIRKNSVTSGANAVEKNKADAGATCGDLSTTFTTLCSEWSGFRIGSGKSSNDEIKDATCDGLGYVGGFDYNQYYKEYSNIDNDTPLESYTHDDATKEYTIPIDNLAQYSCLNIRFQLKQGDQVLTEEPVQVPIIVSGEKATDHAIFNAIVKTDGDLPVYDQSIERCKTCNVVVLSNATLTKAVDDATNDVSEVYNMKVYPGGQVVVPAETNYTINSLAFRRQEDEVSMANIQGTLSVKHANGVYLDVRIDPSNWHYMTLPYDCRVGDVTFADGTPAVVNTDYLLGWYDGAYRAEHKTGGWTYITDNDYILKKGLGYIVALPGDGKVRREIRFPMANDVIAEDLTGKTVSGLYAYGGDKTDAELRPNHKGWNMIGSPYLYTYTTDIVKEPLQMGTLEYSPVNPWDGTWVRTGEARYIVEPIDNGWSGYRQTTISNLKPFTSYFIQVGGVKNGEEYTTVTPETEQQIVFAANSVARNASAPRKVAEAEVTDNHPVWYGVEMIAPNNEKDNTTLLISDDFTDGYDMMDDLVKMRGDYYQYYNFPVLASRNNEGEMAFNALPDSTAAKIGVPLNYYAATAGTYTIATDGKFDLEEVKAAMLYDATTAQYTNLLTDNYSFTTNKGNNTNRFTLFVTVERKKVPNITTGMDNLLANGQLSLIAIERTLVLSGLTENADIYVYDMNGKLITGTHTAGDNGVWRTIVPATGVYFVRVNSANNQQTLRTIVK